MAQTLRLAVLIDGDNAPAKFAGRLFHEVKRLGDAGVRRVYGDFSDTRMNPWKEALATHAIIPQQNVTQCQGKNASDISLVIDAMDLMHSGKFGGFCLVSSDSDFTRLAMRIREHGQEVFGFGEQKTSTSFRKACSQFVLLDEQAAKKPPAK